jgi:hypothetical protein
MKKEQLMEIIKKSLEGIENPTEDQIKEEIAKAMKAGHEVVEPDPHEEVEEIEATYQTKEAATEEKAEATDEETAETEDKEEIDDLGSNELKQVEVPAEISKESQGGQTEEIKFEKDLFGGFSLGPTLRQTPAGNVMDNMKECPYELERSEDKKEEEPVKKACAYKKADEKEKGPREEAGKQILETIRGEKLEKKKKKKGK